MNPAKFRASIAAFGVALSLAGAAYAQAVQGLDGKWQGDLDVGGGAKLTVVFNVATADGKTTVTLDSPDQGATGIPVDAIKRDGQNVTMSVQAVPGGGGYDGELAADGKSIAGTWSQAGNNLPLTLTRN